MKLATILLAGAAMAVLPAAARAETACADLARTVLSHAEVTRTGVETVNGKALCRINVTSRPTRDSDIRIEVWIPVSSAWNGKFVQVGNGGLAGVIPVATIRERAANGYAAAGTDDGHQTANNRTGVWALGHPERLKDLASRSLKETTDSGKALVAAMKGQAAVRSYFVGCSAGGREALIEAQRFPDDFDGIVAGAPANYNTLTAGGRIYQQQALAKPGGYLGLAQLQLLQTAALKACADEGVGYIRDQMACRFDPTTLRCKPGQAADQCLVPAQIASAHAIYSGRPDGKGRPIFPGFMAGAEAQPGGWQAWNTGPSQDLNFTALGAQYSGQGIKYFIYGDPALDILKIDLGAKFDRDRQKVAAMLDAVNPDLTAFAKHGGKLIQYHGWNDPAIPPLGSVRYAGEVRRAMGDTSPFYRLYMIPGMLHCAGGAGPSGVDWLGVLDNWVEKQAPPGPITATSQAGPTQLLCPYPAVAGQAGCAVRKPKA